MSSPGPSGGGTQYRALGKAPPVSKKQRDANNNTRDMALKVLYSFDDQNNSNCLARWPDVVTVRTAALDERTVIGVVDLRSCAQAVVQSSPELVTRGQDYTVYAYDYSEQDVPQSGQGMLTWALAAEASQLVSGRVCKNILGLFSSGVEETLEVKLRLVPAVTAEQNECLGSLERARQQSGQSDSNEWNALMSSQTGLAQMSHTFSAQTVSTNQRESLSREEFNSMIGGGPIKSGSRAPTPNATKRGKGKGSDTKASRPSSRTSVKRPRGRPPLRKAAASGNMSGSEDVGTDGDDGPPRKRVRPSEAEHEGSSNFGDPESLRIRASTAASIRGDLRSRPSNPAMSAGNGLQELPRAPTPVPKLPSQISTRGGSALSKSSLARESMASPTGTRPYISPYSDAPMDSGIGSERIHPSIESAVSSPDCRDSPAQTPQDIASSPPVLSTSLRNSIPPVPSSPILPQMPRRDDSTYGGSGGLFGGDDDDDLCLIEIHGDGHHDGQGMGTNEGEPQAFPHDRPSPEMLPAATSKPSTPMPGGSPTGIVRSYDGLALPAHQSQYSRQNSPHIQGQFEQSKAAKVTAQESLSLPYSLPDLPKLSLPGPPVNRNKRAPTRAASFSSLTLPSAPEMSIPSNTTRSRSETVAPRCTPNDMSESEPPEKESVGRNVAKKARIVSKLEQAIANGLQPDYCYNCGAIETPTWRKAFIQDHQGDPGWIEYSDDPGKIMAVTVLERNETGIPTSYRLFKKSLAQAEDFQDFSEIMLCNPCGIWVAKYKYHRPQEHWAVPGKPKNDGPRVRKPRVRGKRRTYKKDATQPTSEANILSDANFPSEAALQSEASFPQSEAPGPGLSPTTADGGENSGLQDESTYQQQSDLTVMSATTAPNPSGRSSPAREGSRHSPIHIEPDFGSTRRVLFPSPRKDGFPKLLGEPEVNILVRVPQTAVYFRSPKEHLTQHAEATFDQENRDPANENHGSSISALFGEESPARPRTPTQFNPPPNPFKTPTRPTPNHRPHTRSQSKSRSGKALVSVNQTPSKTPARTPRRSPRNNGEELLETPMTFMNRIMNQPALEIDLDAFVADSSGGNFGDDTEFDMTINFDLFGEDTGASYIRTSEDAWDNLQYDILGGHGTPPENEALARILDGRDTEFWAARAAEAAAANDNPTPEQEGTRGGEEEKARDVKGEEEGGGETTKMNEGSQTQIS